MAPDTRPARGHDVCLRLLVGNDGRKPAALSPLPSQPPYWTPRGLPALKGRKVHRDRGIEAMLRRVPLGAPLRHQVKARQTGATGEGPPQVREAANFGDGHRPVNVEKWLPVHPPIPIVPERFDRLAKVGLVIGRTRIGLLDLDTIGSTMPDPRPRLIRPPQAEGELGLPGC